VNFDNLFAIIAYPVEKGINERVTISTRCEIRATDSKTGDYILTTLPNVEADSTRIMNRDQKRVVMLLWCTYACLYLGRLNLSPALPALASALEVSRAEVGVLGTVFFWMYAAGQFLNGQAGNHVSPRRMVAIGFGIVALVNLLFAMQASLAVMSILWAVCGFGHSMVWGPMLRILADRLDDGQRKRISTLFPMSYQLGGAATWAVAGLLVAWGSWQTAFWVPGIVLLGVLTIWWRAGVDVQPAAVSGGFDWKEMLQEIQSLAPMLLAAAFAGFINVGGFIWLPTYVADTDLFPTALTVAVAAVLPLLGMAGMFLSGRLLHRLQRVLVTNVIVLLAALFCLALSASLTLPAQVIWVALTMMAMGGVSALALSSLPMVLSRRARTSSAAGLFTAVYNVGGGLAGFLIGAIVERWDWAHVFLVWAGCALVAAALLWSARGREINRKGEALEHG